MSDTNFQKQPLKLFWDTANLKELENGFKMGIMSGITTNPVIIAKEPMTTRDPNIDYISHAKKIVELCRKYKKEIPISFMVTETEPQKMLEQAKGFASELNYSNLNIKIPIGWQEMGVIKELEDSGIKVNVTVGMNEAQVALAASANPTYFSIFCCHIKDLGGDPFAVISNSKKLLEGTKTEIIVGSIRNGKDVVDCFSAGADIVTAPPVIFEQMAKHPETANTWKLFLDLYAKWGNN
ncbi:MAG: hypothetical protein A2654_02270 [Candidatus Nealsonbacteria bacterium RIFCSPHIGHO2_01_FULL_43_31]|uniref:Transaldolase n=2 Tax=Patescibacteria group TaxID=1783273 RepID=A0A1G2E4N1_9BACT|nr:MAG: hypothetical protein A2654_02270 [Candidatus Nealsonbacteria bacterium RIFCSPHIGHO2_01_FULL_43_31]OGZ24982.1 MAG: hypothetical protein A2922_02640 [Candidatus Nealsonbacteria bacterium RIFCSPLOWO2_01_FULL_43_36]